MGCEECGNLLLHGRGTVDAEPPEWLATGSRRAGRRSVALQSVAPDRVGTRQKHAARRAGRVDVVGVSDGHADVV
jgi:hypothetical protein